MKKRFTLPQLLFLALGVTLAILFLRANAGEAQQIIPLLKKSRVDYLLAGVALTVVYVWLQGLMYVYSFRAVRQRLPIKTGMSLFLRRNVASTFLPMGGLTSLAFFTKRLENKGFRKGAIHVASFIYAFMGVFSVAVVALPVLVYGAFLEATSSLDWLVFVVTILMIAGLIWLVQSLFAKGFLFQKLAKHVPNFAEQWEQVQSEKLSWRAVWLVLLFSIGIEVVGVAHLFLAMLAVGAKVSVIAALMGYVVQVLFLTVSPFFRGFGVIEVSLSFVLTRFGYTAAEGIAIMLLFRFFEFWLVLAMGAPTAAAYRRKDKSEGQDAQP